MSPRSLTVRLNLSPSTMGHALKAIMPVRGQQPKKEAQLTVWMVRLYMWQTLKTLLASCVCCCRFLFMLQGLLHS